MPALLTRICGGPKAIGRARESGGNLLGAGNIDGDRLRLAAGDFGKRRRLLP